MAVCSAVNLTDIAIHVQYRLWEVAKNVIPPGTAPEGSHNPNIAPAYSYNLTRCKELLIDAMNNPLTEFTYYNGTRIPPGIVDNSFGPDKPRTIELHYIAGATTEEKIVTTICTNLNRISWENRLGLTFTPVPVVGGQQYTLAALHQIDFYWGGWHADYNHVLNWLGPAYLSTGSYFSWNLINITRLDELYMEAFEADAAGDVERVVEISNEMNRIANEMWLYLLLWHRMDYFCRSTYLKGWYLNPALGLDYFAPMWFEELL